MEFPLSELEAATEGFDEKFKIGGGGCGDVYRAALKHMKHAATNVAIKRLAPDSLATEKNIRAEIDTLSKYRHPYLAPLLGFAGLGNARPCLVYQLMPQGSLRDRLDCLNNTSPLDWKTRLKIALQSAVGLAYLHHPYEGAETMVHLDVKTDNILLTEHLDACIADFGLVRSLGSTDLVQTLKPVGTPQYICPNFMETGVITEKVDVYAFGVVLGELFTGKQPNYLAQYLRNLMPVEKTALDPKLKGGWPEKSFQTFAQIAKACIDNDPDERPTMDDVVQKLEELFNQDNDSIEESRERTFSMWSQQNSEIAGIEVRSTKLAVFGFDPTAKTVLMRSVFPIRGELTTWRCFLPRTDTYELNGRYLVKIISPTGAREKLAEFDGKSSWHVEAISDTFGFRIQKLDGPNNYKTELYAKTEEETLSWIGAIERLISPSETNEIYEVKLNPTKSLPLKFSVFEFNLPESRYVPIYNPFISTGSVILMVVNIEQTDYIEPSPMIQTRLNL